MRFDPRKEAKFERAHGGEADRKGPDNPAAEQVDNRAYPRCYVDDRLRQPREAFKAKPDKPRPVRRSRPLPIFQQALAATPGAWTCARAGDAERRRRGSPVLRPRHAEPAQPRRSPAASRRSRSTPTAARHRPRQARRAACGSPPQAAGSGARTTRSPRSPPWIAPPDEPADQLVRLADRRPERREREHALRRARASRTARATPRPASACSSRPTAAQSWTLVAGSQSVAINRSIGAIAVEPGTPGTIYIGTAVARHGSSSVNGGRRTPPNAPALGVYKSTDGGATLHALDRPPAQDAAEPRRPPSARRRLVPGRHHQARVRPERPAARSTRRSSATASGAPTDGGTSWAQVFQTHRTPPTPSATAPSSTRSTLGGGKTRIYLGDSSDDLGVARGLAHRRRRVDRRLAERRLRQRRLDGAVELDKRHQRLPRLRLLPERPVRLRRLRREPRRQPGVAPGHEDELWLGGSMNYDELPAYAGLPPRSNGRAVIRSTNARRGGGRRHVGGHDGDARRRAGYASPRASTPTSTRSCSTRPNPAIAFVGSDGGVVRIDVRNPVNASAACAHAALHGHGRAARARRPDRLPARS